MKSAFRRAAGNALSRAEAERRAALRDARQEDERCAKIRALDAR